MYQDAYSGPCQTSKMRFLRKKTTPFCRELFLQKAPSIFDMNSLPGTLHLNFHTDTESDTE